MNYGEIDQEWCVLCGLPFRTPSDQVSRSFRSSRFKQLVKDWRERDDAKVEEDGFADLDSMWAGLDEGLGRWGVNYWDSELVTDNNTAWLQDAYFLGPYLDSSRDSARPPTHIEQEYDRRPPGSVPYHTACCRLFACSMYGSVDATDKIDQMTFYRTVEALNVRRCVGPNLDYGVMTRYITDYFRGRAGEEVLVMDPSPRPLQHVKDLIRNRILKGDFDLQPTVCDIAAPRKRFRRHTIVAGLDPFGRLPYDIIYVILSHLGFRSVNSLLMASRAVHDQFSRSLTFWRQWMLQAMPWLFEMRELFNEEPFIFENKSLKKLYVWLDRETKIRQFRSPPLLQVVNRKRIWTICEQLAKEWVGGGTTGPCFNERQLSTHSVAIGPGSIYKPVLLGWGDMENDDREDNGQGNIDRYDMWFKTWFDIGVQKKLLTYWTEDMSLRGIYMAIDGCARGEFVEDKHGGHQRDEFTIEAWDWVKGFVIHMTPDDGSETCSPGQPVGLTFILQSGNVHIGNCGAGLLKRPVIAPDGWCVVGAFFRYQVLPFPVLGCYIAERPKGDRYAVEDKLEYGKIPLPELPGLGNITWKDNYYFADQPIWEHPSLRFLFDWRHGESKGGRPDKFEHHFRSQLLIDNQALIWGQTAQELESLTSITAYVVKGPPSLLETFDGDGKNKSKKTWSNEAEILGLKVEFSPDSGIASRAVGLEKNPLTGRPWTKSFARELEIDGKGGERISEVHWFCDGWRESARPRTPGQPWRGVKIITNRGREALWCNATQNADNPRTKARWYQHKPKENEVLVGLVTAFVDPCDDTAKSFKDQIELPLKLSMLAGIAMPLEALTSEAPKPRKSVFRPLHPKTGATESN